MSAVYAREGSRPAHMAVLVFFVFSFLWLCLGTLGLLDIFNQEGAWISLFQGGLAAAAVVALAARLQVAPYFAAGAGALMFVAPVLVGLIAPALEMNRVRAQDADLHVATFVESLAEPAEERSFGGSKLAALAVAKGYREPAQLVAHAGARAQLHRQWLVENASLLPGLCQAAYKLNRSRFPFDPSTGAVPADFEAKLLAELARGATVRESWAREWVHVAKSAGFVDSAPPLSAAEKQQVRAWVQAWADQNSRWAAAAVGKFAGDPETELDRDSGVGRRSFGAAQVAFWVALLGLVPVWLGRAQLVRPWHPPMLLTWARAGLAALIRKDPTARYRIAGGLAIMVVAVGVGLVKFKFHVGGRPLGRFAAGLLLMGASVVLSGLSVSDEEESGAPSEGR
ncbi:MAG: hypothetical protein EXS38_11900 [Opitutus sp.]|nr:hypothetical protein [Opitutus sp.]